MIVIRKLKRKDIPAVVNIHKEAIGYSLNASLGIKHLSYIYACVLNSELADINVAEINGIILGVVSATINPEKLSAEIKNTFSFKQKISIAFNLIINPYLIYNLWESSRLSSPFIFRSVAINACLTAIAVSPQQRGKGIGKELIKSVEEYFKSKNIYVYRLDTYKTNEKARRFYKKLGFNEIGEIGRNVILIKEIK